MSNNGIGLDIVPFEWAEVTIHSIEFGRDFTLTIDKKKKRAPRQPTRPRIVRRNTRRATGELVVTTTSDDLGGDELTWEIEPPKPEGSRGKGWAHRYLPTWRLFVRDEFHRFMMTNMDYQEFDWDILFARRLESIWSSYTNRLLSEVKKIQDEGLENILRSILSPIDREKKTTDLDGHTAYRTVRTFLAHRGSTHALESQNKFVEHYEKDSQLRSIVSDINTVEKRMEHSMSTRLTLENLISKMFTGKKKIIFEDIGLFVRTDDGEEIGLVSLSSGEKHVLSIFIETLLVGFSSLLIDEPEISLHVDWQRVLISSMSSLNPESQLIIATQSPEIMAEIPDNKIFRL